jgi:23S rRNA pseudouridine1911/1915/1917 synthase
MVATEFLVAADDGGKRLDDYLSPRLPLLSRTKMRVLIASGAVMRNGLPVNAGNRLRERDHVAVRWDPTKLSPLPPEPAELDVLWEDAKLAAIHKPAGMLMHPTKGVKRGTLAGALLALWNPWLREDQLLEPEGCSVVWPHFVHRLDRETSGVVLVARNDATARAMSSRFLQGEVCKEYLAILDGEAPLGEVVVNKPIARVSEEAPHYCVHDDGVAAHSIVRVLSHSQGLSLALLRPITGRTNQLRIHTAHLGFPILGDTSYGASPALRLFLHAWSLRFPHPEDDREVRISAPVPESFLEFGFPAP